MYSCSNDDSSLNTSLVLNEEIDSDILREVKSRYGADIIFEGNSFKISYDDGSDLVWTEKANRNYIMKKKNNILLKILLLGFFGIINGTYLKINGNNNADIVLASGMIFKLIAIIGLIVFNLKKIKLF